MLAHEHQAETRYAKVSEHLRRQILSGELKPGDRLPSYPAMRALGVSQSTMERVHAILAGEGLVERRARSGVYVADRKSPRFSRLLGVITHPTERETPYYMHLLKGVQEEAHRRNAEVLLLSENSIPKWETLDGVITMGLHNMWGFSVPAGVSAVSLMQNVAGAATITIDDGRGIADAMSHLHSLGHRRIAFFGSEADPSRPRFEAYAAALQQQGTHFVDAWFHTQRSVGEPEKTFTDQGRAQMRQWLQGGFMQLGCTALLAQNDNTAIGILEACKEAGVDVPGDLSIVGFDGLEIGKYCSPSLTTLVVPLQKIGARGAELLLGEGSDTAQRGQPMEPVVLPVQLEIRESTTAPRAL